VEKYSNFYGCVLDTDFDHKLFDSHLNFTANDKSNFDSKLWFYLLPFPEDIFKTYNTYVTIIDGMKIFIPPGELYGDYEKMFLAFDDSTWIAIGVTISVSSLAILIIKWISPENQEIFFGRNNRSPLMEFMSIALNGSQARSVIDN
jgi:hypothetical protein